MKTIGQIIVKQKVQCYIVYRCGELTKQDSLINVYLLFLQLLPFSSTLHKYIKAIRSTRAFNLKKTTTFYCTYRLTVKHHR